MNFPVLLFAAGLGTRMGPLVQHLPKPLIPVGGRALIDHALAFTTLPNIGPNVVNLHYKGDQIRNHLASSDVTFSDETDQLRETGGGLRHALPLLETSPAITMNTDAVWRGPNPIAQLIADWRDDMEALLLIVPKAQVHGHLGKGDFICDPDGQLRRGSQDIYTGVQIIRTETLTAIPDPVFSMNVVWDQMAKRGRLFGIRYPGQWCDVGQPSSIPLAEAMLRDV